MQYFNFGRFIRKYSREFACEIKFLGSYDEKGDWTSGEGTLVTMTGAIMSVREAKMYLSNGTYTEKDKVLYMLSPIDNVLLGADVIFMNNVYSIEDTTGCDDAIFTGVYMYRLKWCNAFERRRRSD